MNSIAPIITAMTTTIPTNADNKIIIGLTYLVKRQEVATGLVPTGQHDTPSAIYTPFSPPTGPYNEQGVPGVPAIMSRGAAVATETVEAKTTDKMPNEIKLFIANLLYFIKCFINFELVYCLALTIPLSPDLIKAPGRYLRAYKLALYNKYKVHLRAFRLLAKPYL
jgi:hypothetical protein